jgi:hypothetical protein
MTKFTIELETTEDGFRLVHEGQHINLNNKRQMSMLFDPTPVAAELAHTPTRKIIKPRKSPCKITPLLIHAVKGMISSGKTQQEITDLTFASRSTIDRINTGYYDEMIEG